MCNTKCSVDLKIKAAKFFVHNEIIYEDTDYCYKDLGIEKQIKSALWGSLFPEFEPISGFYDSEVIESHGR